MTDRETADRFLGHPVFYDGRERSMVGGTDRFRVYVVYRDAVPRDLSRHDHLAEALEERDREIEAHAADGYDRTRCHIAVRDADDPERGDLDHDDLDEAGGAT